MKIFMKMGSHLNALACLSIIIFIFLTIGYFFQAESSDTGRIVILVGFGVFTVINVQNSLAVEILDEIDSLKRIIK